MDKRRRIFSDEFKKARVAEIDQGTLSVSSLSRMYEVSSTSIYRWLGEYGKKYKKGVRMVVEQESESAKRRLLEAHVAELERLLGQKQVEVEYLKRVVEEGSKLLGEDLKKKSAPQCFNGFPDM
jgi:transposase-like protein